MLVEMAATHLFYSIYFSLFFLLLSFPSLLNNCRKRYCNFKTFQCC